MQIVVNACHYKLVEVSPSKSYSYADVMIQNCVGTVLPLQKVKGGVGMGSWSPDEELKTPRTP